MRNNALRCQALLGSNVAAALLNKRAGELTLVRGWGISYCKELPDPRRPSGRP
jgi:hypothetical protein